MKKLKRILSITAAIGLFGAMVLASGINATYKEIFAGLAIATMSAIMFMVAHYINLINKNKNDGNSEKRD